MLAVSDFGYFNWGDVVTTTVFELQKNTKTPVTYKDDWRVEPSFTYLSAIVQNMPSSSSALR